MQPLASRASTLMGNVPVWVGVPLSTPAVLKVRPRGSVEVVVYVTVPMPPVCLKLSLNGESTVAVVRAGGVTSICWQLTTRPYGALVLLQPFASVTLTRIGNVPDCDGVPESSPASE